EEACSHFIFGGLSSAMVTRSRVGIYWLALATLFLASPSPLWAYVQEKDKNGNPVSWTRDRTVVMQLSLIGSRQLSDGFTSFNQSAQDALNVWSPYLAHMRFAGVSNSPIVPNENDKQMSVFFASNYFG